MNNFYKNLLKHNIFYLAGILALAALLFFIYTNIQDMVSKISQERTTLISKSNALSSLASLQGDFEKAKPYLSLLENILPQRDQLLIFSNELEGMAKQNSLDFGFTYGEEKPSTEFMPGSLAFKISLTGSYDGITNFLKSLETERYFIDIASVDESKKGDDFSAVINGKVFVR
jgi:Tfp pilus assembly protein PilO